MKQILNRLVLAFAITLVAFALASLAHAQQADEDPTPVAPQAPPQTVPQTGAKQERSQQGQQNAAATKSQGNDDDETQDALTFTGRIVEHDGQLVLNDPITKIDYQLDDPSKAKSYVGKQVKIVGKLGMKQNTIHIESIEPSS